jgi:hypothetical protein
MKILALTLVLVAVAALGGQAQINRHTYKLTVIGGSGSGRYTAGVRVPLTADAAPAGQMFAQWSVDPDDVAIEPVTQSSAVLITTDEPTTVRARYAALPPK